MSDFPSLELHAEIDTADGLAQYRWDCNARDPGDRPQRITCGSTLMNGYANGGASLARNVSGDYPDLGIYDTIRFVGVDGDIAYEGRGSRFPRDAGTEHRISAEAVGWIAHARDTQIPFLGIDQDMASWGQMTSARQAFMQTIGLAPKGPGTVMGDKTLSQSFDGTWVAGELPICEAVFDAGPGQSIGAIYYASSPGLNVGDSNPDFYWAVYAQDDSLGNGPVGTGSLSGAPANSGTYEVTVAGKRYAVAQFGHGLPGGGADMMWNVDWTRLAVIGNHGLPMRGTAPGGLLASDVIAHTAAIGAPLLDTSGIRTSANLIDQLAVRDLTDPYDIWLLANAVERWNLAVWDNRRIVYEPMPDVRNLQAGDYVLRSDHPNKLTRSYDGPSADGAYNGVQVSFTNILTGELTIIDPTTNPELADTDTRLAANRAGIRAWKLVSLPSPNTPAAAARIGAAARDEYNRQRTPSRFTITGYIQDGAENWHQGWTVRAGQTIELPEDDVNPIRLVHEASWDQDGRTLTINADASSETIDAIVSDMSE